MGNAFIKKNDGELTALVATAGAVLTGEALGDYGLSAAQVTAMKNGGIALGAGMTAQAAAQAAEKAATRQKAAAKANTVASLNTIAGIVYHKDTVTDEMLAAIGFAPRRASTPRPAVATPVTGLVATPSADGSVRLAWDRGSNAKTTMFLLETSADGASWTILSSTTRVSATLDGYAPGAAAWFRVTATTSTSAARPRRRFRSTRPPPRRRCN